MDTGITATTIYTIGFGMIYGIILAVVLFLIFMKRFQGHVKPFIYGILSYVLYSSFLANLVNTMLTSVIDYSSFSGSLLFVYTLCMQIVAILLGHLGKYTMIRFLKNGKPRGTFTTRYAGLGDALMFGNGLGLTAILTNVSSMMMTYYSYAIIIYSGRTETILSMLDEEYYDAYAAVFEALAATGTMDYVSVIIQGLGLFLFEMGSCLLVYRAVFGTTSGDSSFISVSIILQLILVIPTCLVNSGILSTAWVQTVFMLIYGAAVLVFACKTMQGYRPFTVRVDT